MTDCACDLTAIPAAERPAHLALARALLGGSPPAARATADGYVVELPAERLAELARFVENERRCCAHLAFTLEVPPGSGEVRLAVRGPGAREALLALVD